MEKAHFSLLKAAEEEKEPSVNRDQSHCNLIKGLIMLNCRFSGGSNEVGCSIHVIR